MANKKVTINDLAIMTKKGFDEAQKDREGIKKEIKDFREENTKEHEEIQLKLDQVASF